MTDQTLEEQIRVHVRDAMHDMPSDHMLDWHVGIFMQVIRNEKLALIDRIEQSINQHTVPEGIGLLTRSYVRNTLEFERTALAAIKDEIGGEK